jgi:hypothetical protein
MSETTLTDDAATVETETAPSTQVDTPETDDTATDTATVTMTQAELDKVIQTRLARERAKLTREIEDLKATAGKSETEAAKVKADAAEARALAAEQAAAATILESTATMAAIAADARPEKIAAILKLADLPQIAEGEIDKAAVRKAIDTVLKDNPEWRRAGVGSAAGAAVGAGDRKSAAGVEAPQNMEEAVAALYGGK